jgi:anti-sigma factor RsiW
MNCTRAEHLLLTGRDGPLPPGEDGALQAHLGECDACRRLQGDLQAGFDAWKAGTAAVALPSVGEEWRAVRAQARDSRRIHPSTTWFRLGLPIAAAAAVAFLLVRPPWQASPPELTVGSAVARVDYVEAGNARASTLVYEDRESGWLVIWAADADPALGI